MFGQSQTTQPSVVAFGSIALRGNFLSAFTAKCELTTVWIIDSGVFDHMIGNIKLLTSFKPCDENWTVKIADGSLLRVVGTGFIALSKDLTLKFVLLVPNLDCNLLSISKLTIDHNCVAKFSNNLCEF